MKLNNDLKSVLNETDTTRGNSPFGYPEYWAKIHTQFEKQLGIIHELFPLCDQAICEAESHATLPVQEVVCFLTRATMAGASEAIILSGNGCGAGAMKIVRGMYEARWTAEYLRRHPEEIEDYWEFGKVIAWRRVQFLQENFPGRVTEEAKRRVEDEYNKVKGRFTGHGGRVRQQWSNKPLRAIAQDIGCEKEYDLPYAMASSIHHANLEGLLTHFDFNNEEAMPSPPPSLAWVERALLAAHGNLYYAIDTLTKCCNIDFQQQLEDARQKYIDVWSSKGIKAEN